MTAIREIDTFDDELGGLDEPSPMELRPFRRRRSAPVAVGLVLVALSALAGGLLAIGGDGRVAVLVAGRPIEAGERLSEASLSVVELAPGVGVEWIAAPDRDRVLGLAAKGPIVTGQLLAVGMFGDGTVAVGPGRVVVSAVLGPGDVPSSTGSGDLVRMHRLGDPALRPEASPARSLLGTATVRSIDRTEIGSGQVVIDLLVAEPFEEAVTAAAGNGSLKLNLAGGR